MGEETAPGRGRPRPPRAACSAPGWPGSRPGSTRSVATVHGRPTQPARRPRGGGRRISSTALAAASATGSTGPTTTSATRSPGHARCRLWPRSSAGTPCSRTPTGTCSPRSTGVKAGAPISVPRHRRPRPRAPPPDDRVRRGRCPWLSEDRVPVLRSRARGAHRDRAAARGRRHHARGVAGALGARRGAGQASARNGSTAPGDASTRLARAQQLAADQGGGEVLDLVLARRCRRPAR